MPGSHPTTHHWLPEILLCPPAMWIGTEGMGEQPHQWGCRLSPNLWLKGCAVPRESACVPGSFTSLNNLSVTSISCLCLSGTLSLFD